MARPCGGRQRHGNGAPCRARGAAVSTVGGEAEHLRRDLRHQEQLDIPGREEDGGGEESLRTCIWQPLGLLTTVKPPALRERHDFSNINGLRLYHEIRGNLERAGVKAVQLVVRRVPVRRAPTKRPPAKSWWVQKLSADLTAD